MQWWGVYLAIGTMVGFLAGLLGVGGGALPLFGRAYAPGRPEAQDPPPGALSSAHVPRACGRMP